MNLLLLVYYNSITHLYQGRPLSALDEGDSHIVRSFSNWVASE